MHSATFPTTRKPLQQRHSPDVSRQPFKRVERQSQDAEASAIGSCILLGFLKKENAVAEALVRRSKTRARCEPILLPSLAALSLPPTVAPTYDVDEQTGAYADQFLWIEMGAAAYARGGCIAQPRCRGGCAARGGCGAGDLQR